jgi:hypothetical protein
VKDHIAVSGIVGVRVMSPPGGNEIDFDIADDCGFRTDLHNGFAEIWSRFLVPESGMQNSDSPAVGGLQPVLE